MGKSIGNVGYGCTDRTIGNFGPGGGRGGGNTPAIITDTKGTGSNGGTFTSGVWITRNLNTIQSDDAGFVSLAANAITLNPGTYTWDISAPGHAVGQHQIRLRNVTAGTTIANGTIATTSTFNIQTASTLQASVTINAINTFEVQHRCTITKATDGLGKAGSIDSEVYTTVQILQAN